MDTVFNKEHHVTEEELEIVFGFSDYTLEDFEDFNQRSHYNMLYMLYAYRGDKAMTKKYYDLIPNDVRKLFGTCYRDCVR